GDKISDSDKTQVTADLEAVKAILDRTKDQELSDSDLDALKAAKEKLTNSAQSLFTKMYESMQGAQQGGAQPDMGESASAEAKEDDVIDADYREV
ncbi:MAG: molecular chaperone DnaK, partial [Lachnospiraceae bacterium]|nr:molecular chaperone DnaK [Lachnospiraceae bacterium]